ncbi:uncharacterized protein PFL1_06354 [Pseudozyma flocculosa PF-1]|uniref:Uncharacterized protein n=1 Tax=Pseudozyma flocculosa PF-1 TaxID=1277687 RepID=A0A061H6B7_9BASI|nr:uncharacterized protein PFL1_06354 [Pseudozyma flocculosa PF-1]EPQ26146.1 hypothetical protein PFL1_06354 [Pseudozyma flocculosa PF-1]
MAKASTSRLAASPLARRKRAHRPSPSPSPEYTAADDDAESHPDGYGPENDGHSAQLAQLHAFGNAFLASFGLDSDTPAASTTTSQPKQRNDIDRMFDASDPDDDNASMSDVGSEEEGEEEEGEEEEREDDDDDDDDSSVGSLHHEQGSDGFDGHSDVSDTEGQPDRPVRPSPSSKKAATRAKAGSKLTSSAPLPTPPRSRPVETVVFASTAASSPSLNTDAAAASKKGWKAFMSSKISKINQEGDDDSAANKTKTRRTKAEADEEKQLESNDRLLSHLLSTTLFAPGAEKEGKKRNLSSNDTLARIIELSATDSQRRGTAVGRGWGETELQRRQLAKMPAKIRQDIRRANADKRDKERERAKELGTWHPSLKANYSNKATATEMGTKAEPKKRLRGIGAGIGKFKDGTLTLSKSDVRKINGPSSAGGADGKNKRRKK